MLLSRKLIVLLIYFHSRFVGDVFAVWENGPTEKFIRKHNYPVETHYFETKDGYILKAHRIPHGLNKEKPKRIALLVHGMGGNGENYLCLGPPNSLAFYLAERGYDIWLFNARGNNHSKKHRSLNPNTERKKFWNFSWHEIGIYDLPATIDYVLNATGAAALFYVGHSQGATSLFVMLSELPDMNYKIKAAATLAPATHLNHTQSPFLVLTSRFMRLGQRLLSLINWYELVIPNSALLNGFFISLCTPKLMQDICMDLISIIGGTESGLIDKSLLPVLLQFSPSGFAVKQLWHYSQIVRSGKFQKFDYGHKINLKLYKETKPPLYNLSNAKVPIALFYSTEDPFANPLMIEELMGNLPNVALNYQVPIPKFNHLDFIFASNIEEIINDRILEVFERFYEKTDV